MLLCYFDLQFFTFLHEIHLGEAAKKDGGTALMYAAEDNSKEVIELLIRSGSDINAVNIGGLTAHEIAKREGRSQDILDLLKTRN